MKRFTPPKSSNPKDSNQSYHQGNSRGNSGQYQRCFIVWVFSRYRTCKEMSIFHFWVHKLAISLYIDFQVTFMKVVLPLISEPFVVLETDVLLSVVKRDVLAVVDIACSSFDKSNGSKGHVLKNKSSAIS